MQTLYELPDSQWELVRTTIEPKARKRQLRLILSGIIYLLQNGCKWESLPPFYGPYQTVWYYYNKWMVFGLLEALLYKLSVQVRKKAGRKPEPTLLIVDSQSVKMTAGISEETGYDAGKKVKGRKKHIAVDTQGNVQAVGVTAANVHDKRGAKETLKEQIEDLEGVKKVLADGSYRGVPPFTDKGRIEWEVVEKKATGGGSKCYRSVGW